MKRSKILFSGFLLFSGLIKSETGYPFGKVTAFPVKEIEISQERSYKDGVWVSRPKASEAYVADILKANRIDSVDAYSRWIREYVRYEKDNGSDDWASPEETLSRRYGDCDDFAFLNQTAMKLLGYDAKVIAMEGGWGGHAVCAVKENGRFCVMDNGRFDRTQAENIQSFKGYLSQRYKVSRLWLLDFSTKTAEVLF